MSFARARKVTVAVLGFTTAAGIGTVTCAYLYPDFRSDVERKIPQSKELFAQILDSGPLPPKNELKEKLANLAPLKSQQATPRQIADRTRTLPAVLPADESPRRKEPLDISAVDVKKSPSISQSKEAAASALSKAELVKGHEAKLLTAIENTERTVKTASQAKYKTIQAINEHSKALKKAVDNGQNADWSAVSQALATAEKLAQKDMEEEKVSRNSLDSLRRLVGEAKSTAAMASSNLLLAASETQRKLARQLDELNHLEEKARLESRIFNQYKDLVDLSRQQFANELKSVLPGIDVNAKENKLTEDEKNALIAHAHLRVDQLKRQLIELQVQEERKLANAIEEQRLADTRLAEKQLELELRRIEENKESEQDKKLVEERKMWETELESRLHRASLAHADHLESVIRTQKQLHDIENAKLIEEAVSRERNAHKRQVEVAIAKLNGIESALESRVGMDAENRRAKQFWVVCQNLVESIVYGKKAGVDVNTRKKPLANEVQVIKEVCEHDSFVQSLVNSLPPVAVSEGVYTADDLKSRFNRIYKLSRRVAKIDEGGGGSLTAYLLSWIESLLTLEILPRTVDGSDKIDLNSPYNPYEILSRSKYFVNERDDFCSAIRLMQLLRYKSREYTLPAFQPNISRLRGEPARLARDWIRDAQIFEETKLIAEMLIAHASTVNIRSIY